VTLVILAIALVCFGLGEWVREAVRKPWIVTDYLYVHGVRAEEVDAMRTDGIRANALWARTVPASDTLAVGEDIFRLACQNCHARDGYNGLASRVAGWEPDYTTAMIERLEYVRRPMPPFVGTAEEARSLALYLHQLPGVPSVPALPADGRQAYERRCAPCHSIGGFRDLGELVDGLTAEDLDDFMSDMQSDTMPPFTGTAEERQLLAGWLAENVANRSAEATP
jgi:mono/diheme cytochrome c family protein